MTHLSRCFKVPLMNRNTGTWSLTGIYDIDPLLALPFLCLFFCIYHHFLGWVTGRDTHIRTW
ncbi:hypothetical protein BDW59DRAFT_59614 [Aspergillus cavernicola]|uniref:Uncharacterized protein n=1 Tax=Aspergillus cavernicola TaxID=176166 RepID=A0ABR4IJJ4_9EURO